MSLYAWLMVGSLAGPLALSFDRKVAFYRWWPTLAVGMAVNMALFILWDIWFAKTGLWSFNPEYVGKWWWFGLPAEEWSFFVVVPYASIFIYACLKAYTKMQTWDFLIRPMNYLMMAWCVVVIVVFPDRTYTLVNHSLALVILVIQTFFVKGKYMGYFWVAYLVHLIPFFIINGVLTGMATPVPIVSYHPRGIMGFRIGTIPVEDTVYALTGLLLPITITEALRKRG